MGEPTPESDVPVCKKCGTEMGRVQCESCEDGYTAPGELHEMDPLWYDEDDEEPCHICHGAGGWWACFGRCDDEAKAAGGGT